MISFGWRICFWVALPLGAIGVFLRSRMKESASFEAQQALEETTASENGGFKQIFKESRKQLLVGTALVICAQIIGYALTSFMPTYLTDSLGYDTLHGNVLLIPVLLIVAFSLPLLGKLSDRIGRKPIMMTGAIAGIVLTIPAFWLMMQGHIWSTFFGLLLMGFLLMFQVSVQPSTLPSLFPTATRYAAMGMMFNVAVALFGSTTGSVVTVLESWWKTDYAAAYYVMISCVIGLLGVLFLKESSGRNLMGSMPAVEHEHEVTELVETQLENDKLDPSTMPIPVIRIEEAKTGSLPTVKQDNITPEEHVAHLEEVIDRDNYVCTQN